MQFIRQHIENKTTLFRKWPDWFVFRWMKTTAMQCLCLTLKFTTTIFMICLMRLLLILSVQSKFTMYINHMLSFLLVVSANTMDCDVDQHSVDTLNEYWLTFGWYTADTYILADSWWSIYRMLTEYWLTNVSVVTQLTHVSADLSTNTQTTLTHCHLIHRMTRNQCTS